MPMDYFVGLALLAFVYLFYRDWRFERHLEWRDTLLFDHLEVARKREKQLVQRERQLLNILLYKKQNPTLDDNLTRFPTDTRKESVPGIHTTKDEMDVLENDLIQEEVEIRMQQWEQEQSSRDISDEEKARMIELFTAQAIEQHEAAKLTK